MLPFRPAEGVCVPSLYVIILLSCQGPLPMQSQSVWLKDFEYKAEEALERLEIACPWQPRFSFTPASLVTGTSPQHSPKLFPLLKASRHFRVSAVTRNCLSEKAELWW